MPITVLALDVASRTGFASWGEGWSQPKAGIVDLPSEVNRGAYFNAFYEWARDYCPFVGVTHIAVESPLIGFGDQNKNFKLIGLFAILEMLGAQLGIPVRAVANNTMFSHFVGPVHEDDQKAKDWRKQQSVLAAHLRGWGKITDHNIADALGVLTYMTADMNLKTPWDNQKAVGNLFRAKASTPKPDTAAVNATANKAMRFDNDCQG